MHAQLCSNTRFLARAATPEEADAVLVVPLDDAGQRLRIFNSQRADVGQALLQEGLLDAVAVGEDGRPLLAQVHVQARIPARTCMQHYSRS